MFRRVYDDMARERAKQFQIKCKLARICYNLRQAACRVVVFFGSVDSKHTHITTKLCVAFGN